MGSDWFNHLYPGRETDIRPKSLDISFEFEDSNCESCKILFSQLMVTNSNDRNTYERKININNIN